MKKLFLEENYQSQEVLRIKDIFRKLV